MDKRKPQGIKGQAVLLNIAPFLNTNTNSQANTTSEQFLKTLQSQTHLHLFNMSSNYGTASPSRAAAWKLDLPTSSHPAESVKLPDDGSKDAESIIGEDERVLVDHGDLQEGGKYRCKYP